MCLTGYAAKAQSKYMHLMLHMFRSTCPNHTGKSCNKMLLVVRSKKTCNSDTRYFAHSMAGVLGEQGTYVKQSWLSESARPLAYIYDRGVNARCYRL